MQQGVGPAASTHRTQPRTPRIDIHLYMHLKKHRIGPCGPACTQACVLQALCDSEHLRREREEHVQALQRTAHVRVSEHVHMRVRGYGCGCGQRGHMWLLEYPAGELVRSERGELRGHGMRVCEAAHGVQCRDGGK
jgi:hypothetical protein